MVVYVKRNFKFIIKQNEHCFYLEIEFQKKDRLWAGYCLYIIYLMKIKGIDFGHAILALYYQMI